MAKKVVKPGDTVEFARAWLRLGHFARAAGLTAGRVSRLRAEGAIVGREVGRGFEVDVKATLARVGRPDWVWVGEAEAEAEVPGVAVPASDRDGWIEIRGKREALSVPAAPARAVAAALRSGCAIGGLTKGQFSLIDLLRALLERTGPAAVTIAAWSTGIRDAEIASWLVQSQRITSLTWVLDRSFVTRQPEYASVVLSRFGAAAVRTAETHAKFLIIRNADWSLVVRSSMNLNRNPRWEQYDVDDSVALADHYAALVAELVAEDAGWVGKSEAMRRLQTSMGGAMAAPDVYSSTETPEKLAARDAAPVAAAGMMAVRERGTATDTAIAAIAATAGEGVTAADYYTARARREAANASLAELRLAEARGEMIAAEAVERYCADTATVIRERVMEVERLALTQLTPAAHAWLAQALRAALGEASRSAQSYADRLFGPSSAPEPEPVDAE